MERKRKDLKRRDIDRRRYSRVRDEYLVLRKKGTELGSTTHIVPIVDRAISDSAICGYTPQPGWERRPNTNLDGVLCKACKKVGKARGIL